MKWHERKEESERNDFDEINNFESAVRREIMDPCARNVARTRRKEEGNGEIRKILTGRNNREQNETSSRVELPSINSENYVIHDGSKMSCFIDRLCPLPSPPPSSSSSVMCIQ